MTLEVRCCCQPTKLLGYLDVEDWRVRVGRELTFYVRPGPPVPIVAAGVPALHVNVTFRTVTLPIKALHDEGHVYPAISSEGTPLDVLRRIPGFVEARQ